MKLIFLDIDGVLNSNSCKTVAPSGCMFVEDRLVGKLAGIVNQTNAKVVLSSTWRLGHYLAENGITNHPDIDDYNELEAKLMSFGVPIHGYTPILPDGDRSKEIAAYLIKQSGIEAFVILDDIEVTGFESHQVKTDPKHGMTDGDSEKAIMILKG